ncbi:MAG: J domain-containing protein [Candidatus Anammoximicrobium sp.]|nr:J domain-containing protein [Candidatus Anammoximicrobium sp.]
MIDPYEVLGVTADASEELIRQRYLALVREFPPEHAPKRFAEIRAAYDQLRDPVRHLERRLFDLTAVETIDTLLAAERRRQTRRRLPTSVLLSLGEP